MSQDNLKLVIALARTHEIIFKKIDVQIKKFGLNLSEFGVLEFILHKGEQPVQKIAEKILVSSGTITYNIDKLIQRGLVVRRKCEQDKRVYYIALTPEGRNLIETIFPKHEQFVDELFCRLDSEEKKLLQTLLIKSQMQANDL